MPNYMSFMNMSGVRKHDDTTLLVYEKGPFKHVLTITDTDKESLEENQATFITTENNWYANIAGSIVNLGSERMYYDELTNASGESPAEKDDRFDKDIADIKTQVSDIQSSIQTLTQKVSALEGKKVAYVFDTKKALDAWLKENKSVLNIGDNLYIRATNSPDYWWDGESIQILETEKPDLTNLATYDYVDEKIKALSDSFYIDTATGE